MRSNLWLAFDSNPGPLDCESLAALAAVELQQIGYSSATVGLAYPTGAIPDGDTDATVQESMTTADGIYSLSFFNGNYFEGYLILSAPDVNQPTAFTISPWSNHTPQE